MDRRQFLAASASATLALATDHALAQRPAGGSDWSQWRGPGGTGAVPKEKAPANWSSTQNILWKTPVLGRGHGSPTIVGNRIYLATADEQKKEQWLLAFDRATGKEVWRQGIHKGGLDTRCHQKNTQSSSTVACDGEQIYAAFCNQDQIFLSAVSTDGKPVWQKSVGRFNSRFGFSASPTLYRGTVIIAADHYRGGGYLAALDVKTGRQKWKQSRPDNPSYASAIVHSIGGRDQLLIAGCKQIASYDPASGRPLWSVPGVTDSCVGTVVTDGTLAFASGGFPGKETIAITGRGQVAWRDKSETYVPSLLLHEDSIYMVNDKGIGMCRDAKTGRVAWQARIGGNFSASPILAGELIYTPAEDGRTVVFKADPRRFEQVAENRLGQECFTSPVVCDGKLYLRIAERQGGRREFLYCIG